MRSILKQKSVEIARRIDRVKPPKMRLEFKDNFNPSLSDWTVILGTWTLDSAVKHSGNSSVKAYGNYAELSRGSNQQATIICYVNAQDSDEIAFNHQRYGYLRGDPLAPTGEFVKYRTKFWYDSANDTKWGRIERWITDAWVQVGTDNNFGSGSPALGYISLLLIAGLLDYWFDDVEVYSESL